MKLKFRKVRRFFPHFDPPDGFFRPDLENQGLVQGLGGVTRKFPIASAIFRSLGH